MVERMRHYMGVTWDMIISKSMQNIRLDLNYTNQIQYCDSVRITY